MNTISEVAQNPKVAGTVIAVGAGTSAGTILDWLPDVVGIIASLTTIIFTAFLGYAHLKKMRREEEKHRIEMAQLKTRRATDSSPKIEEK